MIKLNLKANHKTHTAFRFRLFRLFNLIRTRSKRDEGGCSGEILSKQILHQFKQLERVHQLALVHVQHDAEAGEAKAGRKPTYVFPEEVRDLV